MAVIPVQLSEEGLYRRVGEHLKLYRDNKRLTQAQLSRLSGVTRSSIANFECGRQKPPLHVLYRLCAALGVEVGTVLPLLAEISGKVAPPLPSKLSNSQLPESLLSTVEMLRQELAGQDVIRDEE